MAKMLGTPVLGLAALMAWHTDPHKSNRASVSRVCEFRTAVGGRGVLEAALETLQEGPKAAGCCAIAQHNNLS